MSLFLSYASDDRPVAERIRDDLARYCEVFLDTRSIPGGVEWERAIDKAIRSCKVFAPIVTAASNESTWVGKETLLAVSVGVPIVPLFFSDTLPLRIVDRQFIDFRGSFEAGFSDLLSTLADHMGPFRRSREDTDKLIAKAIRARIDGNTRAANALVEQFVGSDSELASSGYSFWRKLQSALDTNVAETVGPQLLIKEATRRMSEEQYADRNAYEWTLEVHGPTDALDVIDAVVYTLHPTFPNPVQKVRSREDHFRLRRVGWGRFTVQIHVEFVDYTAFDGTYALTFEHTHEAPLARL